MIESSLTYRFAYKILTIFVFINIFVAAGCTDSYEWDHQTWYEFNTRGFVITNLVLIGICCILFLVSLHSKYHIVINGDKIKVRKYLSNHKVEFGLAEISGFQWHNVSGALRIGNAAMARTLNKVILLMFEDESELLISDYDYKNYEELRDFFYNYCQKNGLIKETTGQARKRRRMISRQ